MLFNKKNSRLRSYELPRLMEESIINRLLESIPFIRKNTPHNMEASLFKGVPLGLLLYNQRALLHGLGALFLIVITVLSWIFPSTKEIHLIITLLAGAWVIDVIVTILISSALNKSFDVGTDHSADIESTKLFEAYFLTDSSIVILLLLIGKTLSLTLDGLIAILFASTIIFSNIYSRNESARGKTSILAIFFVPLIGVSLLLWKQPFATNEEPKWLLYFINIVPPIGVSIVVVWSLSKLWALRKLEHRITTERLILLGTYEKILSVTTTYNETVNEGREEIEGLEYQLHVRIEKVLKHLCSLGPPFWYSSACLWFAEQHQDRGHVFIPGPHVNLEEVKKYERGIVDPRRDWKSVNLILLPSVKHQSDNFQTALNIQSRIDGPGAFIPLHREDNLIGVLALYGREHSPFLLHEERTFLWTFGSMISSAIEQWEINYIETLHKEMDELFMCESLAEVFPKVARIAQKYLVAAGCIVIFRPNPRATEMHIMAIRGFGNSIFRTNEYKVGVGQTGKCAATGMSIRWDDVPLHSDGFDGDLLEGLENAHGAPIRSYMAIPIGPANKNYGVIKVINRKGSCPWFRTEDQLIGESLALRLQVIIEKFLFIEQVVGATDEAASARRKAEATALQRQEDLMIITHQLQGPLSSVVGAITLLQKHSSHDDALNKRLKYIQALVEDALTLCFGTFSTFALEAGREASFGKEEINAQEELRKLCIRLQKTNARSDLNFEFYEESGFPLLRMHRGVFTSVFYSLIHNAMKYADRDSCVRVTCGFDRATRFAQIKVASVGEPIQPDERESIFKKYERGRALQKSGRLHSGVGLGLWVARELMGAIKGDITVELSPTNLRLSVFVVHIPID